MSALSNAARISKLSHCDTGRQLSNQFSNRDNLFPSSFPPRSFWALLRGYLASASWQCVRRVLYSGVGLLVYKLLEMMNRSFVNCILEFLGREPGLAHLNTDVLRTLDEAAADVE